MPGKAIAGAVLCLFLTGGAWAAAQEARKDLGARLRPWLDRTADPAKKWPKPALTGTASASADTRGNRG